MNIGNCYYLGYISKAIGNRGELAFKLDVDSPSSYESMGDVLIQMQEKDEELVPFFMSAAQLLNNGLLRCKVEDINSLDEAKTFIGKSLYWPIDRLPKLKGNQFYFHEVIGYNVIEAEKGKLGVVTTVLEFSTSNLLSISYEDKEILIPITDESIVKVDRENKTLHIKATEGLIDLYLES